MVNNKTITFDNIRNGEVDFSKEFVTLYPKLTQLLKRATTIELTLNGNQRFRQYIWTNAEGQTSGWLCKLEHCIPQGRHLIDEHILLAKTMGGIIKYWLADESKAPDSFIDANTFTFSLTESHTGIGGWKGDYASECKSEKVEPLDTSKFVTFALEANGNTTFYDHQTKKVFVYLHDDYSPFATIPHQGSPLCTIYEYDKVDTFTDFVETLAEQWEKALK